MAALGDRLRRRAVHDEGAAAVEFALVSVVLFMLLFGIIDFGLFINANIVVGNAASVGARSVSLGANTTTATNTVLNSLSSMPMYSAANASVSIQCNLQDTSTATGLGAAIACTDTSTATTKVASVSVDYQHHWITPVGFGITTIHRTSEMVVE